MFASDPAYETSIQTQINRLIQLALVERAMPASVNHAGAVS